MPSALLQEILKAVAERDIVTLQERCVVNVVVREFRSDFVSLPVACQHCCRTVHEFVEIPDVGGIEVAAA